MARDHDSRRRRRGPTAPGRREKIANAAIAVAAARGVERVTHRAAAAMADVPLGSTTYHFATLDDLLVVALHTAAEHNVARLRVWARELPADADLAAALADLVVRGRTEERAQTVVEYELYVAALHRPSLRQASMGWDDALVELFASRTDAVTGRLLAATFCGLVMQGLLADPPPARDEMNAIFRRVLR